MNGQELKEKPPEIAKIPWQGKSVKYHIPGSSLIVEEITEPWDLFLESKYLRSDFGNPIHVIAVQNGMERIFSVRDRDRKPLVDILTKPVGARNIDPYWSMLRAFSTSCPMEVDGQKLIVLEVLRNNQRAGKPYWKMATDFFQGHGGIFYEEFPRAVALTDKKEIKRWQRMIRGKERGNMLISSRLAFRKYINCHAGTSEEAITLLRTHFFNKLYLNIDDDWMEEVIKHLEQEPMDRPSSCTFFGDTARVEAALIRTKKINK